MLDNASMVQTHEYCLGRAHSFKAASYVGERQLKLARSLCCWMFSLLRTALLGDSYIGRLGRFCGGFLGVPGECRFYCVGGMRADSVDQRVLRALMEFQPETVFVCLGGNDISMNSSPRQTFDDITKVVNILTNNGAKNVYIGEIMTRGQFSRSPGLTKEIFDKKRKLINKHLKKKYGRFFVTFSDIHFPDHYDEDKVHLNTARTVRDSVPGMKKFQCRLLHVLCRH